MLSFFLVRHHFVPERFALPQLLSAALHSGLRHFQRELTASFKKALFCANDVASQANNNPCNESEKQTDGCAI